MAAYGLEQVLGYPNLTGMFRSVVAGVPRVLPEAFYGGAPKTVIGDDGIYVRVKGTRQLAQYVHYGRPAHRRALRGVEDVAVKLLHTYEEIQLDPLKLQRLRSFDSLERDRGMAYVAEQVTQFASLVGNLTVTSAISALMLGAIYFDGNGTLLTSSSGAKVSVDFGVGANNKNQLNGLIAASWATASTDIFTQLLTIKKQARRLTGYPLRYAFYGENIPGYFARNTSIQEYLSRNPGMNQGYLDTGEMPAVAGLKWVPVYESFFDQSADPNSESLQSFVGADSVTFTPEPSPEWWEWLHGTYLVPRTFEPSKDASGGLDSLETVVGPFSYGVPGHNPPTATLFQGHTFLPVLKVPDAVFLADVTP